MSQATQDLRIGDVVEVQATKTSKPTKAVVVDRNEQAVAIARLRKDGTLREECLWTGTYHKVSAA